MILLDSYALVALLVDERAADEVQEILGGKNEVAISTINLAEAIDVLVRVKGAHLGEVERAVSLLLEGSLGVIDVGEAVAWRAAELRSSYYQRRRLDVSMADCCLLATAGDGDSIATSDPAVIEVAEAEGISVLELPEAN